MTQEQADFFKMVRSVDTTCAKYITIIDSRSALRENYDELKAFITLMDTLGTEQSVTTTGVTRTKEAIKAELQEDCIAVSGALSSLASKTGNHGLLALVNLTDYKIERLREDKLENFADLLVLKAAEYKADIIPSRLSLDQLTELENDLIDFKQHIDKPKVAKGERKEMTAGLKKLEKEVRDHFDTQMDKLVRGMKKTAPEFVAAYNNARIVYYTGSKTQKKEEPAAKPA